ncbi:MAG: hypothetical protein ACI9DF_005016 [Verrucomicrobiales bacterium]|jgi:hypothetical protein
MLQFFRRHPFFTVFLILLIAIAAFVRYRMQGPHRDYRVNLAWASEAASDAPLHVGVGMRDITPDLQAYDGWTDADGNSKFEPKKGDTYEDRNGNGDFDFVWLGGFSANRPAQGVNDPLSSRAIALRHGKRTVVLVTIDSVGITHERFIDVRKSIDHAKHGIDHIIFSSTHTHNSPDTMGIWSYRRLPFRLDEAYIDWMLDQTREAILEAVDTLTPADARFAKTQMEPAGFVRDSRKPEIYDRVLGAVQFTKPGTDATIATFVSWGNHPEGMGGKNPLLSSDFVHYWREGVEKGLPEPNGAPGLGGICLFFQGTVGGLMTPLGLDVPDRDGVTIHTEDGLGKTRALGENLALRTIDILKNQATPMPNHRLALVAKTIFIPITGTYKYPIMLGIIHPGWYNGAAKSEMDALRFGDIEILTIPGEIYPEIVDGGIEAPQGADFPGEPIETPPVRPQMTGKLNLVVGLANDEIGYILPKTQWDTKAPYTYGRDKAPYGEINSGGPELGPLIYQESCQILNELHALLAP